MTRPADLRPACDHGAAPHVSGPSPQTPAPSRFAPPQNDAYAPRSVGPLLAVRGLSVEIGGVCVADDLSFTLEAGQRLVILGRNGMGKTTLLHTLAGLRAPRRGRIELCGAAYEHMDGRRSARLRGLLPQHQIDAFPSTVLETALIGRHPHLGRWAWEGAADERIAREALAALALTELAERDVHTLSGGERQRLAIATLLAQRPLLYLLDEPLAHLDLNHQVAVLELLSQLARNEGAAVVLVLHDVNLARRCCDRVLALFGDGEAYEGPAAEVLTAPTLSRLFGHPVREIDAGEDHWFVPE